NASADPRDQGWRNRGGLNCDLFLRASRTMSFQRILRTLVHERRDLSPEDARFFFEGLFSEDLSAECVAGVLVALHMKGESVAELRAGLDVIRRRQITVGGITNDTIDLGGTGGDGGK